MDFLYPFNDSMHVCVRRDPRCRRPMPEVQKLLSTRSNKYFVNNNGEAVLREACGRLGYVVLPAPSVGEMAEQMREAGLQLVPTAGEVAQLMHKVNEMRL